jgi:hypothetical protein
LKGKKPLGRPRRKWEDNKMYFKEIDYKGMDWVDLARDRDKWRDVVNKAMNIRVP